jgi:hypothetical protein
MKDETVLEFDVETGLIQRFNAWRTTLGLPNNPNTSLSASIDPIPLTQPLETVMADQLALITGWRIERFVRGSYAHQPFYGQATQHNSTRQAQLKAERESQQAEVKKARKLARQQTGAVTASPDMAGVPNYEPVIDQQQLREAAVEFEHDYQSWRRPHTSITGWVFDAVMRDTVFLLNEDDEKREYAQIKAEGERYAAQLFVADPPDGRHYRVTSSPELAAVVALFDDQVHDSRAWFMHNALASREMWGDYFRYRMVFFGEHSNKRLTPVVVAGRIVGIGVALGGAYSIHQRGSRGLLGSLAAAKVGYEVINLATGEVEPFLPGAEQVLKPTYAIGEVVAQQRAEALLADEALRKASMLAYLRQVGGLREPVEVVS